MAVTGVTADMAVMVATATTTTARTPMETLAIMGVAIHMVVDTEVAIHTVVAMGAEAMLVPQQVQVSLLDQDLHGSESQLGWASHLTSFWDILLVVGITSVVSLYNTVFCMDRFTDGAPMDGYIQQRMDRCTGGLLPRGTSLLRWAFARHWRHCMA